MINDIDFLAVTKLDVLDGLDEIKICTGYRYQNRVLESFPTNNSILEKVEPVYESMPGWRTSQAGVRLFDELADEAKRYLKRLEELVGIPIGLVSVGSEREGTIFL
jgi:adenylosuccinate synthase